MKTNKNCPMYKNSPVTVAPTDEEVAQHEASISQDDLVKVEGTKVYISGSHGYKVYVAYHCQYQRSYHTFLGVML